MVDAATRSAGPPEKAKKSKHDDVTVLVEAAISHPGEWYELEITETQAGSINGTVGYRAVAQLFTLVRDKPMIYLRYNGPRAGGE